MGKLMVLCSYNAFYCYIFMFVVAVYNRSMFHVAAWSGVFFTELMVSLAAITIPDVVSSHTQCDSQTHEGPSRSMAIVTYVMSYYIFYNMVYGSNRFFTNTVRFVWYFAFALTTAVAPIYLQLSDIREVATGMCIGIFCGMLVSSICTFLIVPNFDSDTIGWLKLILMVNTKNFR
jgi:hypothetical protein